MSRAWIKPWRLEAQSGLGRPPELYTDGGYISGPRLQRAAQEGWALMGPAKASPRRPGVDRLPVEDFNVSIAHRWACCPAGHPSGHCSRLQVRQPTGGVKVFYRFEWRQRRCQSCPLREKCVPPGQKHRKRVTNPRVDSGPQGAVTCELLKARA